ESGSEGFYTVLNLPPEHYCVTVEYPGFKKSVVPDVRVQAKAQPQQIAAGHRGFQLARSPQRNDAAMIDDGQALAQRVRLFHVVRSEQNGFAAGVVFANDFPKEQARLRSEEHTSELQSPYDLVC